ncbi:hypothetical protein BDP27DRAFT_1445421 [Rhodocollybia butyracea]|uniref:BTB domain-containing protein n=1 Tax=Rhodocollybia butyracea TaxID=206335 RepID=A0A9P5UB29_9AGAR|nr:hypothetical protein BDP27DRAFT_1445421 [Rhodocollybia butyracea]
MNSSDIQSHLYNSFLTRQTSDVCIHISGAFNAIYRLHRVVLIQAGFWKSLFTGGFSESEAKKNSRQETNSYNSSLSEEVVHVVLDDRNITRAAFELSIARLYGAGPSLYIHPSLVPTATRPLTPGFPFPPVLPLCSSLLYPPDHQPAFPEFLISLLATSIYLSIPSLASEALTGLLRTIGPRTVLYYLHFALGKTELRHSGLPAVGLDSVAEAVEENSEAGANYSSEVYSSQSVGSLSSSSIAPRAAFSSSSHSQSNPRFSYGPISDKIGEACTCWLSRWGADMFAEEEKVVTEWLNDSNATLNSFEGNDLDGLPFPSNTDTYESGLPSSSWFPQWSRSEIKRVPRLFTASAAGLEGLSATWIHALISSNEFFIPSPSLYMSVTSMSLHSVEGKAAPAIPLNPLNGPEEERYIFAKRVVELRRAVRTKIGQLRLQGTSEREETEEWDTLDRDTTRQMKGKNRERTEDEEWKEEDEHWDRFFRTSIHYENMVFDALIDISNEISPSTGRPYVDLRTLQEASWQAGIVRCAVMGMNSGQQPRNLGEKLGFTKTVSELLSLVTKSSPFGVKPYFVIPVDESLRVGDTITTSSRARVEGSIHNNITMDELFACSFGESYLHRGETREGMLRRSGTVKTDLALRQAGEQFEKEKRPPSTKTSNEKTFFGLIGDTCYLTPTNESDTLSFVSSLFPPAHTSFPSLPSPSLGIRPSYLLSSHPPLRFSIEFFNLEMLKEKDRLSSRTVWYAGSLWNVYVQIVKRKDKPNSPDHLRTMPDSRTGVPGSGLLPNYHLGVYLHRQSSTSDLPLLSAPDPLADIRWPSIFKSFAPPTPPPSSDPAVSATAPVMQATSTSRGPSFPPLTPYASAPPQVASSSRSPPNSRHRSNTASIPVASSSRPSTAPGSPPSQRTPGGSGGWRSLANPASSSGSGFLSSSLPTVFPAFGRSRHQSSSSKDGGKRNIEYRIPSASASNPYVPGSNPSPSPATPPIPLSPSLSTPTSPPPSLSPSASLSEPPFQASPSKLAYPYIDLRPVISVYFSVNCASPSGNAQTRFRSAPDKFKVGQSWGWKSSGLIGGPREVVNGVSDANGDHEAALVLMGDELHPQGQEVSLRATVVLGIV